MKKKFLILIITLLLTGCANITYDLDIKEDLKVEEKVFITATSEYFSLFYKNFPKTIVSEWYSDEYKDELNTNNYTHKIITEDVNYPGVLVNKSYNSLTEFTNNTIFKTQIFEDMLTITNNNLVTIKSVGFLQPTEDETYGYSISKLLINIKVPYVVEENNADKVDKKTNTYTWVIDNETENKDIKFTFDKNKKYVYNFVMYISLSILILLLIIFIFVVIKIIKKGKKNNRISE